MNPKTTFLLAFLALLVSFFAWRVVQDVRPQYLAGADRPFTFAVHAVSSLEIERNNKDPIRIEKAESGWRIVAPIKDQGRYAPIEDLLLLLRDLKLLGDGPANLARTGLSDPAMEVSIETPSRRYTLQIGSDHPSLPRVYALVNGQSVLISHLVRDALRDFQLSELRENAVFGLSPNKVNRVLLEREGQEPIVLIRKENSWDMRSPIAVDADGWAVEEWLSRIAQWAAVDYLDGDPGKDLGLDSPRAVLTVENKAGQMKTITVGLPVSSSVQGTVAVRSSDRSAVLVAAGMVAEELVTFDAATLMSDYLLRLDDPQTVRVELSRGKYGDVNLTPNPAGGWIVDWSGSPTPSMGDQGLIEDWISRLREQRVLSRFPADRSALQQWGFDIPSLRLDIESARGEQEQLVIGSEVPEQPGVRFVWNLRRESFATCEFPDLELLQDAPFSLKDLRVTSLASGELIKFELATAEGLDALLVRPAESWRDGQRPVALPQPDVRLIARRLSTLVASRWLPEQISAPGRDRFTLKATLYEQAEQDPFITIYFGEVAEDGLRRARIGDSGWIFSVLPTDGPDLVNFCQRFLVELNQQGTRGGENR